MFQKALLLLLICNSVAIYSENSSENLSIKDSAYFYIEKAKIYKAKKIFDKAIETAHKSIIFGKNTNDAKAIASGYYCVASINMDLKQYDIAIENLLRAISILNSIEPNATLALSYNNLAVCYLHKNNYSKSEIYFKKAHLIYDEINLPSAKHIINLQKGLVYLQKNKANVAESIFVKIARLAILKDILEIQTEALFELGKLKYNQKAYNLAINYLERAYSLSLQSRNYLQQFKITKKLSEIYSILNKTDTSTNYLTLNSLIKDSLQQNVKKELLNSEQFNIDKITHNLEKIEKEKASQQKSMHTYKLLNILSIASIAILSLLSIVLYRNNATRKKINLLLAEKNLELQIAKQKIEENSKTKMEFLAMVSHELRTPLNAINGISHLLLEEKPRPNQLEYLKSLRFSGNYLLTYINDILEINRLESDVIEIEYINFNIRELFHNIENTLKEEISKNKNHFIINIDPNIPEMLIGDKMKITQIFINLLNNALKFTHNGVVTANIKLIDKSVNNCKISFEVKDTGIGIPKEQMAIIFDSFKQGSVEINRKYGGTGLGLVIVKRLLALFDENINLDSEVGVGSNFYFNLKFKIGAEKYLKVGDILNKKKLIGKHVLLVEDNKINQMVTKKFLEKKNMTCDLAENGEDAIQMAKENKYDMILMDVHLPGINGTIATAEIRKFNYSTPVIALTAISLKENREILLSYGMNDVITKPFNPDIFYITIEKHLPEDKTLKI